MPLRLVLISCFNGVSQVVQSPDGRQFALRDEFLCFL
jgi:hypothetical protein